MLSKKIEDAFIDKSSPALLAEGQAFSRQEFWGKVNLMHENWSNKGSFRRVLVSGRRDVNTIVALTLCLWRGYTFSVIDPAAPSARRLQISRQFQQDAEFDSVDGIQARSSSRHNPILDEASYVVFTSGSTGIPKGVVVGPENLWWFSDWYIKNTTLAMGGVFSMVNPLYFDNAIADICAFSMSPATGVLVENLSKPIEIRDMLEKAKLTHWFSSPSMIRFLLSTKGFSVGVLSGLSWIGFGGEPMYMTEIRKLSKLVPKDCQLVNIYGPSECTCITSMHVISVEELWSDRPLPLIGKMNANCSARLLAIHGQDNQGELVISGPQVSRGYLSGEGGGFFLGNDGTPAFRTGDIMQSDGNGDLTFVSRADRQLKIMGHRVEPSEIENFALGNDGVAFAACVSFQQFGNMSLGLVYQGGPAEKELRSSLGFQLPKYMVPQKFMKVDSMPLNRNGKIDYSEVLKLLEEKDGV